MSGMQNMEEEMVKKIESFCDIVNQTFETSLKQIKKDLNIIKVDLSLINNDLSKIKTNLKNIDDILDRF